MAYLQNLITSATNQQSLYNRLRNYLVSDPIYTLTKAEADFLLVSQLYDDALNKTEPVKTVEGFQNKTNLLNQAQGSSVYGINALRYAQTQLNYRETKNNGNKYGAFYGSPNLAWCAFFVAYCLEKSGSKFFKGIVGFSYVPTLVIYFRNKGLLKKKPSVGDIVLIDWDGANVGSHTGFVSAINKDKNSILYISGNTGDPHLGADGVFEKKLSLNSVIVGFVTPTF